MSHTEYPCQPVLCPAQPTYSLLPPLDWQWLSRGGPDCAVGYPAGDQFLVLGVRLEDGRTLADYNIQDNTTLHMRLVRVVLCRRKLSLLHIHMHAVLTQHSSLYMCAEAFPEHQQISLASKSPGVEPRLSRILYHSL